MQSNGWLATNSTVHPHPQEFGGLGIRHDVGLEGVATATEMTASRAIWRVFGGFEHVRIAIGKHGDLVSGVQPGKGGWHVGEGLEAPICATRKRTRPS
jgi:hypothetical protein